MDRDDSTEQIAILTDSACDLPRALIDKYGIFVLPLRVVYHDNDYRDGVDIQADEVYGKMPGQVPTTSLPAPGDLVSILEEIKSKGFTHVLAVHLSGGMSGTLNMVKSVSSQVRGLVVDVIDSKSLSMGLGFPVMEAAQAVRDKASFATAKRVALDAISRVRAFYVVETLEYLIRGGRIGKVSGSIGELLNVKPIISINDDGIYYTYAKVRGRRKSLEKLFDIAKEMVSKGRCSIAVLHGGAPGEAHDLEEKVRALPNVGEVLSTAQIGPVLGVHTGPGLVGVCVMLHS